jgi:hypothetical protein
VRLGCAAESNLARFGAIVILDCYFGVLRDKKQQKNNYVGDQKSGIEEDEFVLTDKP